MAGESTQARRRNRWLHLHIYGLWDDLDGIFIFVGMVPRTELLKDVLALDT